MNRRIGQPLSKRTDRRGFTLTETTVAMVVLAAAIVAVAQLMAAVATRRLASERETVAQQEVANLMERVFIVPWAELSEENVAGFQLSETCQQRLPEPKLDISVKSAAGSPAGRQVRVELTWMDSGGQSRRSAGLTAWRYAAEEPGP
jgi:prepilin-type N-terminal cleavage/methylation domain-containing protein